MIHAHTLARPYARAAFALARQQQNEAGWSHALVLAARLAADPGIAALIKHPALAAAEAAGLVAPPGELPTGFLRFLGVLAENRRLALLPQIADLYLALQAESRQVVRARVSSAVALDAATIERLRQALKARFHREVELETSVDPTLIGGAVIDTGDVVIDGSVRNRLARLDAALTH